MLKELMTKKANELTVSDHLKLNGLVIAVMAGGMVAISGANVAYEEVRSWKAKRNLKNKESAKKEEK